MNKELEDIKKAKAQYDQYNKVTSLKNLTKDAGKILALVIVFGFVATMILFIITKDKTVSAQKSPPFYWEFMNVDIDVQENGNMLVTETQKYVFTAAHTNQRYRYIPLDRVDYIDNVEVFEGERNLAASSNAENGQQWIKWRHTLNPPESHIFTIKYRVKGGLHIQSKEDLVY